MDLKNWLVEQGSQRLGDGPKTSLDVMTNLSKNELSSGKEDLVDQEHEEECNQTGEELFPDFHWQ